MGSPVNLQQWITHPERFNADSLYEVRTLVARYPYAQTLRLLYLQHLYLLHDSALGAELRKAALSLPDRRVIFSLIEKELLSIKPLHSNVEAAEDTAEPGLDRTITLIDAFLLQQPDENQSSLSGELIDYTTDYTTYLLEREEPTDSGTEPSTRLNGQDLIDEFIEKSGREETAFSPDNQLPLMALPTGNSGEIAEEEGEEESFFTETLAKIYIRQQRYEKALEIIKKLSLKYPKKNIYFADQIRFLEKLIINAKTK
jgi:hypothetical protein